MTTLQDTFLVAANNTVSADVLTGHCFQKESLKQGCINPGTHVATAITFCMVARNIFLASLHGTCLISPFWSLKYQAGSQSSAKFVHACSTVTFNMYGINSSQVQ